MTLTELLKLFRIKQLLFFLTNGTEPQALNDRVSK